jgi:hypothetical protein
MPPYSERWHVREDRPSRPRLAVALGSRQASPRPSTARRRGRGDHDGGCAELERRLDDLPGIDRHMPRWASSSEISPFLRSRFFATSGGHPNRRRSARTSRRLWTCRHGMALQIHFMQKIVELFNQGISLLNDLQNHDLVRPIDLAVQENT